MTDITYGTLRKFLKGGYEAKTPEEIEGYILDKDLSHSTAKVYYNAEKNEAIINHRGSKGMLDWLYNAAYMYGGEDYYKLTPRYYEAKKAQEQTEKKYGSQNTITIGHSSGGLLSELLGRNSKQIITLNKAARPVFFPKKKHKNQLDIRSKCDIISAGGYYDKQIECSSADILAEHKTDILDRIGDKMVGTGKINFSQDSIAMNFSHLTPNALANMKHSIRPDGKPIDDSRFTIPDSRFFQERPRKRFMRGRGLVAESGMSGMGMGKNPAEPMIKNPQTQHPVQIPEKGTIRQQIGRGLVAEGSGEGLVAEGSGEGMCGTGKHTGKGMCGTGKGMKGSVEMKEKMAKLRAMRKNKK